MSLVAALACGLTLVACGGGGGGGTDVDALTGCLEDAGMKVKQTGVDKQNASKGLTDTIAAGSPDAGPTDQVQIGVFGDSADAEKYASGFGGHLKQVDTILIFALDTGSKDYDQAVSCAGEATG